jgi:CheY-like chemotaxis protein
MTAGAASGKKVLVVDDEADVVEMLRLVLSKNGYEVLTATSGMDGLTRAESDLPDLILLDIMMHRMDGWEVLKLLKLDERTCGIPVVILSARAEPKDKIRGLQEGAIDYVTKPFAVRDLLIKIAGLVGGGSGVGGGVAPGGPGGPGGGAGKEPGGPGGGAGKEPGGPGAGAEEQPDGPRAGAGEPEGPR